MITRAGPDAGDLMTAAHRRLTLRLEERHADGAAREMERFLGIIQHAQGAVRPAPRPGARV